MSYDLRIYIKTESGRMIPFDEPFLAHPTYNLRNIFVESMEWNYNTTKLNDKGEWETIYYPCDEVLEKLTKGIMELSNSPEKYKHLEPENGWGTIESAIRTMESVRNCILDTHNDYELPLNEMYFAW